MKVLLKDQPNQKDKVVEASEELKAMFLDRMPLGEPCTVLISSVKGPIYAEDTNLETAIEMLSVSKELQNYTCG